MTLEEILADIRSSRDEFARECGNDPHKMGERLRAEQREDESRGVRYVSFVGHAAPVEPESSILREDPPKQ